MEPSDIIDVVADHQVRNRPNKPPNQQRLFKAAQQQLFLFDTDLDGDEGEEPGDKPARVDQDENNNENEDDDGDEEGPTRTRAVRHSKSTGIIKPTTANYYSHSWKAALVQAKYEFRRYIILHNLFPLRDLHLSDAASLLSQVITGMKAKEPTFFDSSKAYSRRQVCLLWLWLQSMFRIATWISS